jgi:hypothetical protein
MAALHWWAFGSGVYKAWTTIDDEFAEAEFRLEQNHLGWRASVHHSRDGEIWALQTYRQAYDLDTMQRLVELLRLEPLGAPEVDHAIADAVSRRLFHELGERTRCRMVHAWPANPGPDTRCQCGRLSHAWAVEHGMAAAS